MDEYVALSENITPLDSTGLTTGMVSSLVEHSPNAIYITNLDGGIIYANRAFEELTGYTQDDVLGQNPSFMKSDEHDAEFFQTMWETLRSGKSWTNAITNIKRDDSMFTMEWTLFPIEGESGKQVGYAAMSHKASRDAELEAQLRQAQKLEAIGQLASGIAHEINTPTQYIGDNLQFFNDSIGGFLALLSKYQELVDAIEAGTTTDRLLPEIAELIEQMDLEFLVEETPGAVSRAIEGNHRVAEVVRAMKEFAHPSAEEMMPTDINRAIENTISVARNEWKYVADMETTLDRNLPLVSCLSGQFNQVILNILVNAAHAIGDIVGESPVDKGIITVITESDNGWAVIKISDTGGGIPEEIRSRVFNPFFTTKEIGKGTGQGLAIAHSVIVDTHGGILDLDSEVGKGTTFTIRIPIHPKSDVVSE